MFGNARQQMRGDGREGILLSAHDPLFAIICLQGMFVGNSKGWGRTMAKGFESQKLGSQKLGSRKLGSQEIWAMRVLMIAAAVLALVAAPAYAQMGGGGKRGHQTDDSAKTDPAKKKADDKALQGCA